MVLILLAVLFMGVMALANYPQDWADEDEEEW